MDDHLADPGLILKVQHVSLGGRRTQAPRPNHTAQYREITSFLLQSISGWFLLCHKVFSSLLSLSTSTHES